MGRNSRRIITWRALLATTVIAVAFVCATVGSAALAAPSKPLSHDLLPPVVRPSAQKPYAPPVSLGSWKPLTHAPPSGFHPGTMLLLTDGSVLVAQDNSGAWEKLTPSSTGSYVDGTWSSVAPMPAGYQPLYYASAVLPDGRVIVEGGEYNGSSTPVWTNLGAIYNPRTNTWTPVSAPSGWSDIGDAQSEVLPNGTFMMAHIDNGQAALLDASTLTWSPTGSGKADRFDEEGWSLLPNGKILTVDTQNGNNTEVYEPSTGVWSSAGNTPFSLVDSANDEIGPLAGTPKNSSVLAVGANGANAYYHSGIWHSGAPFPVIGGQQYDAADGPAATLPNGQILVAASPGYGGTPTHFFLYNPSINTLTQIADTPDAFEDSSYFLRMIVLPTGQVMENDSGQVQVYTPAGTPDPSWKPNITSVTLGEISTLSGTQLNGLDQGSAYGDDVQNNTNYPLARVTNDATKTVNYLQTSGMSTLGIGAGQSSTTRLTIPAGTPPGPGSLVTVANGIASDPAAVNVPVFVNDGGFAPAIAKLLYGATLKWTVSSIDTTTHDVADNSRMGLFDSGSLSPGADFSFTFPAAGNYPIVDRTTAHTAKVMIAPTATPTKGTTSSTFTVTWASSPLPAGYVEDVYWKMPGSSSYTPFVTGTTNTHINFGVGTPGIYYFDARLRNTSNNHYTNFSPGVGIKVS